MSRWQLAAINQVDIGPIMEIEKDSFAFPWNPMSFLGELTCKHAYSYKIKAVDHTQAEKTIAYIFFRLIKEELHILKIAVTPQWRCRGVATWLLKKCCNMALELGATSAFLEVRPSNQSAIDLYRKEGFRIVGRRPNYYADTREDALVLMKNF